MRTLGKSFVVESLCLARLGDSFAMTLNFGLGSKQAL